MSIAHELRKDDSDDNWPRLGYYPTPPGVTPDTQRRLAAALGQARAEAWYLMGRHTPPVRRGKPPLLVKTKRRKTTRPCRGCGCPPDDFTQGCRTCSSRHAVRRWNARKREKQVA